MADFFNKALGYFGNTGGGQENDFVGQYVELAMMQDFPIQRHCSQSQQEVTRPIYNPKAKDRLLTIVRIVTPV